MEDNKVGETEEKPKSLIDRFWWVIPPVFLTFVYWPLLRDTYNLKNISLELYIQELQSLFSSDVGIPIFFWSYFLFGFMVIGMLWIRRWALTGWTREGRLIMRIIVPIVFGILGSFIGLLIAIIRSPLS